MSGAPPHMVAFAERSEQIRRDHLCSLLRSEHHCSDVYARCAEYVTQHTAAYGEYRQRALFERHCSDDWGSLTLRQQIHLALEYPALTGIGVAWAGLSVVLVLVSIAVTLMETHPTMNPAIHREAATPFLLAEAFFTLVFTIETLLAAAAHPNRTQMLRSPSFVADFLSITPFYVVMFLGVMVSDLEQSQIDAVRMLRAFRLMKFFRLFRPAEIMVRSLRRSLPALAGPLFFLLFFSFVAAATVFYVQRGTFDARSGEFRQTDCACEASAKQVNADLTAMCRENVSPFGVGIPLSLWWSMVTTMTVGFGDVVPSCPPGQIVAVVCMVVATMILAMPIAVMGASFTEEVHRARDESDEAHEAEAQARNDLHRKAVQIVVARRLHEVRPDRLAFLCRRYGLPVGTVPQMRQAVYDYFGLPANEDARVVRAAAAARDDAGGGEGDAPSTASTELPELPAVMSLAESLIDYIKKRTPYDTVDFANPTPETTDIIDSFFERAYAALHREDDGTLAARLEVLEPDAVQRVIPLFRRSVFTVGISVPGSGVPDPDIVLPLVSPTAAVAADGTPTKAAAMAPRMAVIDVIRQFGDTRYVLRPFGSLVPLVGNTPVPAHGVVLRDRDLINFGTRDSPVLFSFAQKDEYSATANELSTVNEDLGTKVWLASKGHGASLSVLDPEPPRMVVSSPSVSSHDLQRSFML